jgi:hypothetical protein
VAGGQLFVDAVSGAGGKLLVIVATMAMFFCGLASVTANSRMIYAFSRDGAIPGHKRWHRLNVRSRTPVNAVWLAVVVAFLLGLPSLYQRGGYSVAFFAIVSIGTVGLYVAYVIPVFLRLRAGSTFTAGPWNLGRSSRPPFGPGTPRPTSTGPDRCSSRSWGWSPSGGSCQPGSGSRAPACRAHPRSWPRSSTTWRWATSTTASSDHPLAAFSASVQRVSFGYRTLVMKRITVTTSRRVVR